MLYCWLFIALSCVRFLVGEEKSFSIYEQWTTGPLLIPAPVNADPKHPIIEPTLAFFCTYGKYDNNWKIQTAEPIWGINPALYAMVGVTERFGVEILVSEVTNFRGKKSATHIQDVQALFGYQISSDQSGSWVPDFRVMIQEAFPTGHYQHLNPEEGGIDISGEGSFQTGPVIAWHKKFYPGGHLFALYGSMGYLFPTHVSVEGPNYYGGGPGTRGKVDPGQTGYSYISGEYSLTPSWVFAFDTQLILQRKCRFSGTTSVPVGIPFSVLFTVAPEIEYNFSESSGLLGGVWLTAFGKNANAFASVFLAYLYIF